MSDRIKKLVSLILKMYSDKDSTSHIASKLGINVKTVRNVIKKSGVILKKQKENLLGQRFGDLTVVRFFGRDNSKKTMWVCECKCGKKKNIRSGDLISGKIRSCGCLYKITSSKNMKLAYLASAKNRFKGCGELSGKYLSSVKYSAMIREIEYKINPVQLWNLFLKQNKKCALSGLDICFGKPQTASIDRINSEKGYILLNVQWVHKDINLMKLDFTTEQFLDYCKLVTEKAKI